MKFNLRRHRFQPTQAKWRIVFMICATIYIVCATFYNIFGSGERQPWDSVEKDDQKNGRNDEKKQLDGVRIVNESQH